MVDGSAEDGELKQSRVIELDAFYKIHPAQKPFFAVCTGPYKIEFRIGRCGKCGAESFVREYSAKILALKDTTFPVLSDDDRADAGRMDSIALAMYVMTSGAWVCSQNSEEHLGLSALHSAMPKWVLNATSKVIFGLERKAIVPFSRLGYEATEVGGKTLTSRCPSCEAQLPAFQTCAAMVSPMTLTLQDDKNVPILYSWPVIVSAISRS
jgi:hypothetical protein